MRKLIHEIHRRSLWQVLGIYLAGSYGALEAVGLLADNFGLPEWFPGLALGLLVLGLPIVVATAFVQEGVGRGETDAQTPAPAAAAAAERSGGGARRLLTWRNALIGGGAAALMWLGVAVGWLMFGRGPSTTADAAAAEAAAIGRSIAVLPFATRSDQTEDRYFAEGMHDDLLTQLAKIDSLTVISRTSVMQFAETTTPIREIAEQLQVATVLEGGVQRAGDRVRVNVQLIDAANDRHLWAETYDQELTAANVFAIQTDLARKIADALHATLSPAVERRIEAQPTESLEALDLYARARFAFEERGAFGEDIEEITGLFESAISADSTFAPAWAGLGRTYMAAWSWRRMPAEIARSRARAAIDRAITLDPDLPEAYLARASLLNLEDRHEEALAAARRAIELHPGSAYAHSVYGRVLQSAGRHEEAVRVSRRAVELDPLSVPSRRLLADRLFFAGQFAASADEARKVLEMAPGDWYAYYSLGWALAAGDSPAEGVVALRAALANAGENVATVRLGIGYAFARAGQRDSALAYVRGIAPEDGGYDVALVLFEAGEGQRAFDVLETALRANPESLNRLRGDPSAIRMREDPRFTAVLRRLGLE